MPDYPRLIATFRPQAWRNDYAIEIDGAVDFDATDALLSLELEHIRNFEDHNYDSDYLAEDLPERLRHDGPFEVDADIDEWLERNGVEGGRGELTQEQLELLRERFEVGEGKKAKEYVTFKRPLSTEESTAGEESTALIIDRGVKGGRPVLFLRDGTWCYEDDVVEWH